MLLFFQPQLNTGQAASLNAAAHLEPGISTTSMHSLAISTGHLIQYLFNSVNPFAYTNHPFNYKI